MDSSKKKRVSRIAIKSGLNSGWVSPSFDDEFESITGNKTETEKGHKTRLNLSQPQPQPQLQPPSQSQSQQQPEAPLVSGHESINRLSQALKRSHVKEDEEMSRDAKERSETDADEGLPWAERFAPKTRSELAIHFKKVKELEEWFDSVYLCSKKGMEDDKRRPFLLLTGPAGSGKSTALRLLAKERGIDTTEFSLSTSGEAYPSNEIKEGFKVPGSVPYRCYQSFPESQLDQFKSFVMDGNKYAISSLVSMESMSTTTATKAGGRQRLLLVDDFPYGFHRNPKAYHEVLRKCIRFKSCVPLAFVVSYNSAFDQTTAAHLFPIYLREELVMKTISFNPIAPSILTKVLMTAFETYVEKEDLKAIVDSSSGDVRNAFNSVEIKFRHLFSVNAVGSTSRGRGKKKKLRRPSLESNFDTLGRDTCPSFFHALGKICYSKRLPAPQVDNRRDEGDKKKEERQWLPDHLDIYRRAPLKSDPNDLIEKMAVSEEKLNLYLHQNYIKFAEDIDQAAECSRWLSEADCFDTKLAFEGRPSCDAYRRQLPVRGLMFNLASKPLVIGNNNGAQAPGASDVQGDVCYRSGREGNGRDARDGASVSVKKNGMTLMARPFWFENSRLEADLRAECKVKTVNHLHPLTCDELVIDILPYVSQMKCHQDNASDSLRRLLEKAVTFTGVNLKPTDSGPSPLTEADFNSEPIAENFDSWPATGNIRGAPECPGSYQFSWRTNENPFSLFADEEEEDLDGDDYTIEEID